MTDCNEKIKAAGGLTPRTCRHCGLGPCTVNEPAAASRMTGAEKHKAEIERTARAMCQSTGTNPDAPIIWGTPRTFQTPAGVRTVVDRTEPAWQAFADLARVVVLDAEERAARAAPRALTPGELKRQRTPTIEELEAQQDAQHRLARAIRGRDMGQEQNSTVLQEIADAMQRRQAWEAQQNRGAVCSLRQGGESQPTTSATYWGKL